MPGFVLAVLAALLDLLAVALGWHAIRAVTKPLPALILAALAWRAGGKPARTLSVGLVLASIGDEILLGSADVDFLLGMLAFAAMQITYILSYLAAGATWNPKTRLAVGAAIGYGAAYAILLDRLLPHAGTFAAPLVVYGALLTMMGALSAQLTPATAIGGLCFVCSDMLLALTKFQGPVFEPKTTELLVMATYFSGQLLITWGMTDARDPVSS